MNAGATTSGVLEAIIALLALSVAFNLFLTLRLTRIVGHNEFLKSPMTLPIGEPLPSFEGRPLGNDRRVHSAEFAGRAAVLLFFSPDCKDCQARVAEISAMHAAMRRSGVGVWVISSIHERRMREFLKDSPLLDHALMVRHSALRTLNPRSAAPFYIFIDHERTVLASNFIGDEDWLSFCRQMRDTDAEAAPAAA